MSGIDYRQLRRQVTMSQVLELIGFRATWRQGSQLRGPCPILACRSTSSRICSVDRAGQTYRCFACSSRGNHLDLWAAIRGLTLHRAAVDLCQLIQLSPPWLPTGSRVSAERRPRRAPFRAPSSNR
jgi:DNA primase